MNLRLTEEQKMLVDSVRKMMEAESSSVRIRAAEAAGFDPLLWRALLDNGVIAMRVDEASGGTGMSLFDAILVAEQAGRHLVSVPLAAMVSGLALLATICRDSNSNAARKWLTAGIAGIPVVLALKELDAQVQVLPAPPGSVALVLDGDALFAVRDLPEVGRNLGSAALALFSAGAGTAELLASGPQVRVRWQAAVEEWKLLQAAMLAGLAARAVEMAAAYAGERQQFGKLIGAFQGIAHPLADALAEVDGARLLVWRAVWAIARQQPEAAANVSMAWWWSASAATRATACALHTFGGYGVSLEYDIQLYYRRAKAWCLLAGDPQRELDAVADRLWGDAAAMPLPLAGQCELEFDCGEQAHAFAAEVQAFFETHMTPELRAHAHHSVAGYHAGFNRELAQAGLLFPHWPKEFGGRGKTPFDMAALAEVFEENNWQRITGPVTNQIAQAVIRFGSAGLKQEVLPRLASGEALACIGFTEPSSGSDVFAARTRAERDRDGDGWLINGQKIFTTAADVADYIFLLARTSNDVPKHAGLTLFLVPMNLPGIDIQAVHTIQDERTNITYLSQVRVDDRYRIGEVNGGINVMAANLEIEHGGDQYRVSYSSMYLHVLKWARDTMRGAGPMLAQPEVRRRLARVAVHQTIAKDLCYRAIWAGIEGIPERAFYGPMSKLFSTEHYRADAADLMDLAAPWSLFASSGDLGHLEMSYRQSIGMTIYGGTSEVHRSLVAEQGLGMPRSRT